jgi:hypothetical protein
MALVAFQLTATGTAQQLPSNPVLNSITLAGKAGNAAAISVGSTAAVTASTGFLLGAGVTVTIPCRSGNTNEVWIIGTANDVLSIIEA